MRTSEVQTFQTNAMIATFCVSYWGGRNKLSNSCSRSRISAQIRPRLVELAQLLAVFGKSGLHVAHARLTLADVGQLWANLGRTLESPDVAQVGPNLANFDQSGSSFPKFA